MLRPGTYFTQVVDTLPRCLLLWGFLNKVIHATLVLASKYIIYIHTLVYAHNIIRVYNTTLVLYVRITNLVASIHGIQ